MPKFSAICEQAIERAVSGEFETIEEFINAIQNNKAIAIISTIDDSLEYGQGFTCKADKISHVVINMDNNYYIKAHEDYYNK